MVFVFLSAIFSGCGNSSDNSGNQGVIDDSSAVTNFMISLDDGETKMMVSATNDKESLIYTSFMRHRSELDFVKGEVSGEHPSLRVFNYKGPDARYTLIVKNYNIDHNWYMLCPYHVSVHPGIECILSGKIDNYVFQTYISDLTKFNRVVSAIKEQSRNYVK
jgi:hypothetical protein